MFLRLRKSTTEESLVAGCRKQDPRAQQQVYERWSGLMLAVCMRYIKDRDEAESTMLNGFYKVFDRIGQFSGEGSFEGWIRRIMVNEALTYIRRNQQAMMMVEADEALGEVSYESASQQLEAEDLMQLIREMPEGYRTVFNLIAIEGYSHKEVAEQLGISENTSKSQLNRARNYLQKQLAKHEKMCQPKAI
jgi:RNA polymerase sigma factor (sigma-70 family)